MKFAFVHHWFTTSLAPYALPVAQRLNRAAKGAWVNAAALGITIALTACGGGGSTNSNTGTVSGTVSAVTNSNEGNASNDSGGSINSGTPPAVTNAPAASIPPTDNALQIALKTGDASALTDIQNIAEYTNNIWSEFFQEKNDRIKSILGDRAPEYIPGKASSMFDPLNWKFAQPLIVGDQGYSLAAISLSEGGRGVAYGLKLLLEIGKGSHASYIPSFRRVLSWLVAGDANKPLPSTMKVVFGGGLDAKAYMLGFKTAGVTAEELICDFSASNTCLKDAHLLVLGGDWPEGTTGLEARIRNIMASGIPVMYLHTNQWWNTPIQSELLKGMELRFGGIGGGNNWIDDRVSAGRSAEANRQKIFASFDAVRTLVNDITANKFAMNYDWSKCRQPRQDCDDVPGLRAELINPLQQLKEMIDGYTEKGENLFTQPNTELLRPLVLWADLVRKNRVFPYDKEKTPAEHKKSLISDYFVPYIRPTAVTNPDLGKFMRPAAQSIPVSLQAEDISIKITGTKGFTTIGRLGIPGKTFTIELIEGNNAAFSLFLNTQHPNSTKYWGDYNRPKHLRTPPMPLRLNTPLTVASPYGGTMQLQYDKATIGQIVKLRIKGVAQHPYLDLTQDKIDIAAFKAGLDSGIHDWVEVKTQNFEIHSKLEKVTPELKDEYKNDVEKFINEVKLYLVDDIEELAGFYSPTRPLSDNVKAVCDKYTWDCTNKTLHSRSANGFIQHANVDVNSRAGDGTAGNPYDQSFNFSPRGWGESHEIGHTIQPSLLEVSEADEVSNNIFPLHKQWRLFKEGKRAAGGGKSQKNYSNALEILRLAQSDANPSAGAFKRMWQDGDNFDRLIFYSNWVHYFTVLHGKADDTDRQKEARGWDIYTLLYLHQRLFDAQDQTTWLANRDKLGYSTYAVKPKVTGDDNLLIMLSKLSGRDQRPTFKLWGIKYSEAASAQVASFQLIEEPKFLYANTTDAPWINAKKIDLSGAAANWKWPF